MIRTQISLPEDQMERLRAVAHRRRVSLAAVVRRAVEEHLAADPDDYDERARRAWAAVGIVSDPDEPGDVSEHHDAYLADGLCRELEEKRSTGHADTGRADTGPADTGHADDAALPVHP